MTNPADILELPLHLVGISDQITDWLRQAGFPVLRLGQDSAMKSAFGLKRHREPKSASHQVALRAVRFPRRLEPGCGEESSKTRLPQTRRCQTHRQRGKTLEQK